MDCLDVDRLRRELVARLHCAWRRASIAPPEAMRGTSRSMVLWVVVCPALRLRREDLFACSYRRTLVRRVHFRRDLR